MLKFDVKFKNTIPLTDRCNMELYKDFENRDGFLVLEKDTDMKLLYVGYFYIDENKELKGFIVEQGNLIIKNKRLIIECKDSIIKFERI